jgi:4-carboxymuconolactone decarboxylase
MARVNLLDEATATGEIKQYFADLRAWLKPLPGPRAGHKLIPQCWRAWGHSPKLARWLFEGGHFALTECKWGLEHLKLRQLAIVTVARRLRCDYAVVGHWPLCEKAGLSRAQYDALVTDLDSAKSSAWFDEEQRLVIAYADELASHANAGRDLFKQIVSRYGERGAVELTGICGFYAMQAINLNALEIEDDR